MSKRGKLYLAIGLWAAFAVACAMAGGTTKLVGLVKIHDGSDDGPTGSVATTDGELLVEGDLEADGNMNIAGTCTCTGASTMTGLVTATNGITATNSIYTLTQADLGNTCTVGELKVDTASTKEICYCASSNTWYCISLTTATGPTD